MIVPDLMTYSSRLRSSGVPESQAAIHAEIIGLLAEQTLATKEDLLRLEVNLKSEIAEVKSEIVVLKWIDTAILGLMSAVVGLMFKVVMFP